MLWSFVSIETIPDSTVDTPSGRPDAAAALLQVALFEPEIPPNTGNIIRLCANTGADLHLIRPFGFEWDDKRLRRAGLDYHDLAHVTLHDDFDACLAALRPPRILAYSTRGTALYTQAAYAPGDLLLFGPETRGLPADLLGDPRIEQVLRLPMQGASRSLNLANATAVVLYEAWRQLDFRGGA